MFQLSFLQLKIQSWYFVLKIFVSSFSNVDADAQKELELRFRSPSAVCSLLSPKLATTVASTINILES